MDYVSYKQVMIIKMHRQLTLLTVCSNYLSMLFIYRLCRQTYTKETHEEFKYIMGGFSVAS